MEAGGGPERDDYGLPPVDVEIPDDARELDPDVQAYRRELRALRRQERANRLRRPLRREGMALPLLAASLMLALITSTLLVLFAADETGMPALSRPAAHGPTAGRTPASGQVGQPLPTAMITIGGRTETVQTLTKHGPSLLALASGDCSCGPTLRQLANKARTAHVALYLIGAGPILPLMQLAASAGQGSRVVGDDIEDILPVVYNELGLTAVLVQTGGSVAFVARDLEVPQPNMMTRLENELRQLSPATVGR